MCPGVSTVCLTNRTERRWPAQRELAIRASDTYSQLCPYLVQSIKRFVCVVKTSDRFPDKADDMDIIGRKMPLDSPLRTMR